VITNDGDRAEVRALCLRMLADLDALDAALKDRTPGHYWSAPKLTGRARRTSMDLTRALAELRRH